MPLVTVRPARPDDAAAMAQVHVTSWQETYRGVMRDAVLDDPAALAWRGRFWTAALTDGQYASNHVALAEVAGEVVGIAMSGPPLDTDAAWSRQLYVLYLLAAHHGSGAGTGLLSAVLPPEGSAGLWVAEASERARAFYAKRGFTADGAARDDDGVGVVRMKR